MLALPFLYQLEKKIIKKKFYIKEKFTDKSFFSLFSLQSQNQILLVFIINIEKFDFLQFLISNNSK